MHRPKPIRRLQASHLVLASTFSVPWVGCSSDHLLGDLPQPQLQDSNDADDQTGTGAGARDDFLLSAELGPPEVTLREEASNEFSLVNGIGDFDGDGFDDFAARASENLPYVHLRYGGPRPTSELEKLDIATGGARLGLEGPVGVDIESIVPVGDVDADGYSDFLVGLGRCGGLDQLAFVVYGRPERLSGVASLPEVGVSLKGPPEPGIGSYCSFYVESPYAAGLGDFDGDGFDDFVLVDPRQLVSYGGRPEILEVHPGGAYLFYGGRQRLASGTAWQDAAVRLHAAGDLPLTPTGDVNGDGLADLILGALGSSFDAAPELSWEGGFHWLPGRTEKLTGDVYLEAATASTAFTAAKPAGDLDGDGLHDLFLYDEDAVPHLFYGAHDIFAKSIDLAEADATFESYALEPPASYSYSLTPVQDRDGDGDDELISSLHLSYAFAGFPPQLLALLSGSASRASGSVDLPQPKSPFPESFFVEQVFPVGDLDGDGAAELVTRSQLLSVQMLSEGEYDFPAPNDLQRWRSISTESVFLNIHYGTPGVAAAQPVR